MPNIFMTSRLIVGGRSFPVPLLFENRFLSFLYVSIDDAVEPFDSDVEFSEPDELDFEIIDLAPADADDADDDDDEDMLLVELDD